jgi:hypothetical protein
MYLHLVINIDNVPIIQTHRVYVGGKRNRPNITADASSNNQPNNPTSIGNSISEKLECTGTGFPLSKMLSIDQML